jgi:3-hydroxyacyl-CoA dehydrogenase
LQKLEPCTLAIPGMTTGILPADYDPHLEQLADCGLVIEAIVEHVDLNQDLYRHITPYLDPGAILLSNASGPSINKRAGVLPACLRQRFCGIHFLTRRATCIWPN